MHMHVHTKAQGKTKSKKAQSKNKSKCKEIKMQQNQKFQQAKNTRSEKYNKPPGPQLSPATWPPATPSQKYKRQKTHENQYSL